MDYLKIIENLIKNIPTSLVDFSLPRDIARTPTQASSNFITNKEQGDWAENLIFTAINKLSNDLVAVKYGKSDDLVAGEEGFEHFFQEFQDELDKIGKRPDLLIFKRSDFDHHLGFNISKLNHKLINDYVKKAIAGIEVRSSAFLIDNYDKAMNEKTKKYLDLALHKIPTILQEYSSELSHPSRKAYLDMLNGITEDTILITDFRVPSWSSTERLLKLKNHLRDLKSYIKEVQKRDYLSITPKVEDIKVVYKWIETFNVPHLYFQVFFDKVYGISFKDILEIISDSDNEGVIFSVESDTKNQNKTTIKIDSKSGVLIADRVIEPSHHSVRKELGRGRLLFHVSFEGGEAYLNLNNLYNLLGVNNEL